MTNMGLQNPESRAVFHCSPDQAVWIWVAAWLVCLAIGISAGRKHTPKGWRSYLRLIRVCAVLGWIETLPVFVLAGFGRLGIAFQDQAFIAAGSTLIGMLYITLHVKPPIFLQGTKEDLPLVSDEQFLARVAEIAHRMGVARPLVRLWPSVSGSQQTMAFVGTLQAPQMVVTDGILRRLSADETDAIVAHELGHIANHSLWILASITPVVFAFTTAVGYFVPLDIAIPFGLALLVGLRRIISRPIEFDCDYRAARAMGFRATWSALAKIHAAHAISNTGLVSLLVYATATHPSRNARLAALYRAAPPDDRPENPPEITEVQRSVLAQRIAVGIWGLILIGAAVLASTGHAGTWMAYPLWLVTVAPNVLIMISLRKQAAINRKRLGSPWRSMFLALICALGGIAVIVASVALATFLFRVESGVPGLVLLVEGIVVVVLLCVWLARSQREHRLQHAVAVAMQVHDFNRAESLCTAAPKIVSRSQILRYQQAIAKALCRDRETAISELQQLWIDKPRFPMTAIALCELLLDDRQTERSLEIVSEFAQKLPQDGFVPLFEARAFRRLGRLDEALEACRRALSLEPDAGGAHAAMAASELDRGNTDAAKQWIASAQEHAPGDSYVMVVRAEVALRCDPIERARQATEQAIEGIRANPLIFLNVEIERLEKLLAKVSASQTTADSP